MKKHGLQKSALRLGRSPVDLVGQDDVGEDGASLEAELFALIDLFDDGGAGDVGRHKVRSALNPAVIKPQAGGRGLDQQRLRQPGIALQEGMASGQDGDQ
jgi:hypothetical protein